MKRMLSTIVLFVLLILTVVALHQLGDYSNTSALKLTNEASTVKYGTH